MAKNVDPLFVLQIRALLILTDHHGAFRKSSLEELTKWSLKHNHVFKLLLTSPLFHFLEYFLFFYSHLVSKKRLVAPHIVSSVTRFIYLHISESVFH